MSGMIAMINIISIIIFTIPIIKTKIVISHEKKSVIFVAKKIVAPINIEIINNKKQKMFEDEGKNLIKIKENTIYF